MSDGALQLTAEPAVETPDQGPPTGHVLMRSTAAAVVYRVLNVASGVVTLPLLLGALSRQEFGTWLVMSQSVSLFALSDLAPARRSAALSPAPVASAIGADAPRS